MAEVSDFCIDRWEIHLVDDNGAQLDYTKHPPYNLDGFKAVSAPGKYPNGYMSRKMANAACKASGKRLCKVDEWEKTCRGPGNTQYPYGNEFSQEKCNVGFTFNVVDGIVVLPERPHILDFLDPPPENATEAQYKAHHSNRTGGLFNDPRAATTPGYLAKAGEFGGCTVTWNGRDVYDIVGNLSEWTGSKEKGKPVFGGDGHSGTSRNTLRDGTIIRAGCSRTPAAHNDEYHDYSMGTRCCRN